MPGVPMQYVAQALPAVSQSDRKRLLGPVLRDVSRAFYLTLRVLPRGTREPVALAYLLARAADTIADTPLLPADKRMEQLLAFRQLVIGPATLQGVGQITSSVPSDGRMPAEETLLASLPQAFALLESLDSADRGLVRSVVVALTQGMEMDLTTFALQGSGKPIALQYGAQLDAYVYQVAGCVGEFWTAITMAHSPALKGWDADYMSHLGVRFGKALQMTNVLRDVGKDVLTGRCYLPQDQLAQAGLAPEDLLDPSTGQAARRVLMQNLHTTLDHYAAAEDYLIALPRRCLRLRLAAAWPILIGLATLARLARNQAWLDPERPSRVSRRWVYRIMIHSLLVGSSNTAMRAWIRRLRRQVMAAL